MTLSRIIPITQGADRDLVIMSALRAADAFINNPTRTNPPEGSLCHIEYLCSRTVLEDLDRLVKTAIEKMGERS